MDNIRHKRKTTKSAKLYFKYKDNTAANAKIKSTVNF